ncbi:MAG: hypothetical protein RMY28_023570 [Nostoc sp. ChiSLP01]|nr:hypothetical protein [Nostoc sp. CmiSLP01]MDZ8289435.1 hypothetical protein [Nostoc sp. ChiSLP01]
MVSYSQFNGVGVARRRHRLYSTTSLRSLINGDRYPILSFFTNQIGLLYDI